VAAVLVVVYPSYNFADYYIIFFPLCVAISWTAFCEKPLEVIVLGERQGVSLKKSGANPIALR